MFSWTLHQKGSLKVDHRAAVAVRHKLYCFGRNTDENKDQMDVHVFNTVSLLWKKVTPETSGRGQRHCEVPSSRQDHTAVLIEDTVYLWGGFPYCNVLYAFDVDAHMWFKPQVSGTVPEGRHEHSACVLGKVMIIHGGRTRNKKNQNGCRYTNDTYKLDTTTMVWTLIKTRGPLPPTSDGRSATIIGTKMFVFGGLRYGYQCLNTITVFDTETNCWMNTSSAQPLPEGREDHSVFTYNGELYVFGGHTWKEDISGRTSQKYFNDLWKLSPETFCWKKVKRAKGKGPSLASKQCCCMVGDHTFLFGGYNTPADLYVLDLSPSLKTLCKLAVIQYGLEQSGLPHNIRWELAAMPTATENKTQGKDKKKEKQQTPPPKLQTNKRKV